MNIDMKDTDNGMTSEAFKTFAERMANDKDFRSDTLMMTVSLIIRNIQAIEARLSALEEAVAGITGQQTGGVQ
ncbi:MAG: hypothetical protein IJG86_06035 [Clostridia bacterium]|nr:hypothetical protein [Clostridia bacterium]